jgi:hypothetical protein
MLFLLVASSLPSWMLSVISVSFAHEINLLLVCWSGTKDSYGVMF